MTEGRGVFLRVGVLVLTGFALVIGLIWFFGGSKFRHGEPFESYFRASVQGLDVGSPVKYRGVSVGQVTELGLVTAEYGTSANPAELDRQTYRLVFVRFLVDRRRIGYTVEQSPDAVVQLGLRVRLASQGITGLNYLELDFVDPKQYPAQAVPWTPEYPYIPSMPSTLQQVQDAATQFLAKLNHLDIEAISTSLTGLITDLRTDIATGYVHTALAQAAELLGKLNATVSETDLPGLTADLRQTSGALRTLAEDRDLHRTLANAAVASDRLAAASARLGSMIATLQAAGQRTDNGVADLQQGLLPLLRDLQATASNLRETTDELRRYPAQVLLSDPPQRTREPAK